MLTKIVYDKYWRSWFLHDYKASSGEEAKLDTFFFWKMNDSNRINKSKLKKNMYKRKISNWDLNLKKSLSVLSFSIISLLILIVFLTKFHIKHWKNLGWKSHQKIEYKIEKEI